MMAMKSGTRPDRTLSRPPAVEQSRVRGSHERAIWLANSDRRANTAQKRPNNKLEFPNAHR